MAEIYKNGKGFLVIKTESMTEVLKFGGLSICDSCNKSSGVGYYIAVLNHWYDQECFNEWYRRAKRYKEDIRIEEKNFEFYAKILGV